MTELPDRHDFYGCQDPACQLCAAYATGYAQGEARSHFELRHLPQRGHLDTCGCSNCETVRGLFEHLIVRALLSDAADAADAAAREKVFIAFG